MRVSARRSVQASSTKCCAEVPMNSLVIVAIIIVLCAVALAVLFLWQQRSAVQTSVIERTTSPDSLEAWEEIQPHLPEGWSLVSALPAEVAGTLQPVDSVHAEAVIRGLGQAAPTLLTAVGGDQVFRMVGPPKALEELSAGTVDFLRDKSGRQLMSMTGSDGRIAYNARVENVGGELRGAAAAACIFQGLSVVTAQYYLHGINKNLTQISGKMSDVLGKLADQRWAKLRAAQDVVLEVNRDVANKNGRGILPQQLDATAEFWTRMANAETALREVIHECEHDYQRQRTKFLAGLCQQQSDGSMVRKRTNQRTDIEHWSECLEWHNTVGEIHVSAVRAMAIWYQIILTHDSLTRHTGVSGRYGAMVLFMRERAEFFDRWQGDLNILLADDETTITDDVKDLASGALWLATYGTFHPARTTKRRHLESAEALVDSYNARRLEMQPLLDMVRAMESPSTFYLLACGPDSDRQFDVLLATTP